MCAKRLLALVEYHASINVGDPLHVPIVQTIEMSLNFDQPRLFGRLKATRSL